MSDDTLKLADLLWQISHAGSAEVAYERALTLATASTGCACCAIVTEDAILCAHGCDPAAVTAAELLAAARGEGGDGLAGLGLDSPGVSAVALDGEPAAWVLAVRPGAAYAGREHERLKTVAHVLSLTRALLRSTREEETLRADRERHARRLHDARRELAHQATHDRVTGLPTREAILDHVTRLLTRDPGAPAADGRPPAAFVVDLDHFRRVNETLTHGHGDRLLGEVGARLTALAAERESPRQGLIVGRYGSDEFIVLAPRLGDEAEAAELAHALREAIGRPFTVGGRRVTLTCSIGVSRPLPDAAPDVDRFVADAELALEEAKAQGGDRHAIFTEALREHLDDRARLQEELRDGIARGELRLLYQPVVTVAESRMSAVEALVRWEHPTRGRLGPGEFIAVAERSDLIVELGAWVIDEACAQIRRWRDAHPARLGLRVSVNVSARQLSPALVATVSAALARHEVAPSQLALEITETVLVQRTEACRALLGELAALGVCIVLDDFGTGYSSLGYLREFPLHQLKLDRSFCAGLADDLRAAKIVAATIEMARALGMTVVAEGVETLEQLAVLRRLGSDFAQGFWFARPETPEAIFDRMLDAYASDRRVASDPPEPAAGADPVDGPSPGHPPGRERRRRPGRRAGARPARPAAAGGIGQVAAGALAPAGGGSEPGEAWHRLALGRLFALLFIAAPLIELPGDLLMHAPPLQAVALLTTMAILTGVMCLLAPWERLSERMLHGVAALGTIELVIAGIVDGRHAIVLTPLYPLAAATIAYGFRSRRAIALQTALIVAARLGVTLGASAQPSAALPQALVGAIVVVVIVVVLVFLRERMQRSVTELRRLADRDPLTDVGNYRLLHERLRAELAHHRRTGESLTVLLVDLDGFKHVNERLGHAAGDDVLRRVGRTLRDAARREDTVARQGGDEFAVLAPATDADGALMLSGRLGERLRRIQFAGETIDATIGCAVYPADGDSPEALLAHADSQLLGAKRAAGRPALLVG